MNCNDLRYIKTEDNLKSAFLKLLENHPLEEISITALCAKARCSRNAFYQHYQTKYDLFHSIMNDMLSVIVDGTRPKFTDKNDIDDHMIQEYSFRLLDIVNAHRNDILSMLKGNNLTPVFLSDSIYHSFLQHLLLFTDPEKITEQEKIITKYIASGIAGFIEQWIKNENISIDDAKLYLDLCTHDALKKMKNLLT